MRLRLNRGQTKAYTLIEVLIVVAIIGVAGAVVVPQMLRAGSLGVQAAGRMIIADILIAQNEAIANQATRRVVFNPDTNSYSLTDDAGTVLTAKWRGNEANNYVVDFDTDDRFEGVTLENVAFGVAPDNLILEFDALGSPTGAGGTVDLVFNTIRYQISVAPFTGRITIAPVVTPDVAETTSTL